MSAIFEPGNANFSPGNEIPSGGGFANYNAGFCATYNPPPIIGYNPPVLETPNYNTGNPATYTGNNISAYNAGVGGTYNTGTVGGYNEGSIAGYTGNSANFSPGNPANYTGNNIATYNAAGNATFSPGNVSGYTSNFIANYNAGTENYNSPTITAYNPTNAASYNPPSIVGYSPPGGGGGGGGCCFSGDTLITMSDHSTKPINTIEVGDEILSYNFDTEELETNEVSQIVTRVNRVMFEYVLQNGIRIKASDDHPLFVLGKGFSSMNPALTMEGYKSLTDVAMIAAGDSLVDKNGNAIQINQIVPIDYPYIVYTINNRYKSSPTFFANGVLTY